VVSVASRFSHALFAFIALPGMVAYVGPMTLFVPVWREPLAQPWGLVPLVLGTVGLLWCVRDFYVSGRGTLAPWSPPQNLVIVGLYRYSRNPMYISVLVVLIGWTVCYWSGWLLGYTLLIAVLFHLRVVFAEERWLARIHGDQWDIYRRSVPRWIGF
jgi:protein-S-isoprenylcysteine O-methyltransferase Ste14